MKQKCNICAKFLTCDKKECKKISFVEAKIIDKPRKEFKYERNKI